MDVWPCVFDIQGRKLVGKTQQRILYIVNANMPMVQKNQTNETLGAEEGRKKQFPNYVQPATETRLLLFKQTWLESARRNTICSVEGNKGSDSR